MKPFDENDLIAYHLGELSPRRALALEKAIQADPSLAVESEAYATMLRSFKGGTPLDVDEEIVERNWSRLWSKLPRQPLRSPLLPRWLIPVLTGAGVTALAATALFISTHHDRVRPSTGSVYLPDGTAQSRPSIKNPSAPNVRPNDSDEDLHDTRHESGTPTIAQSDLWTEQRSQAPSQMIYPAAKGDEPAPMLRLIPLARTPLLLPPTPEPLQVSLASTPEPQLSGSGVPAPKKRQSNSVHREHPMDVTLAMGGMLTGTHDFTSNGATHSQGATHAVSAIASFHQQRRSTLGYRVAVSSSRPDFLYGSSAGQTGINGRIYEVAGTYVVQGPHRGIVNTTVEAGGGVMAILPSVKDSDTGKNMRGAAIVGVSAEFAVSKHLAIQTSYRMQIFKGPDFQSTGTIVPIVTTTLISNEPMVGITYRFAHK